MMLWDIIRDYFVQYIFGGFDSGGHYFDCNIGMFHMYSVEDGSDFYQLVSSNCVVTVNGIGDPNYLAMNGFSSITFGDWLSTTATIIVMVGICVALFFFIRWLFRLTAGLIKG